MTPIQLLSKIQFQLADSFRQGKFETYSDKNQDSDEFELSDGFTAEVSYDNASAGGACDVEIYDNGSSVDVQGLHEWFRGFIEGIRVGSQALGAEKETEYYPFSIFKIRQQWLVECYYDGANHWSSYRNDDLKQALDAMVADMKETFAEYDVQFVMCAGITESLSYGCLPDGTMTPIQLVTPQEALQLQVSRDFLGTLGYAEHEQIAKQILTHLSVENNWNEWLLKSDYDTEDGAHYGNWRRSMFLGASDWQMISFDDWVIFDEHDGNRFQVTQKFIDAMQFKGN